MSDLLIKGMEMPKECYKNGMQYCLRFYSCPIVKKYLDIENDTSQEDIYHKRLDGCPLVEVPPHGDLCDKDKLKEATKNTEIHNSRGEIYPIGKAIAKMIDEAPTVLEAST